MKTVLLILSVLVGVGMLFAAHHVKPSPDAIDRRYTLWALVEEIFGSSFSDITRGRWLVFLIMLVPLWVFFPAWFFLLVGWLPKPEGPTLVAIFVIQGLFALLMAGITMVVMLIQQTGFGWGASSFGKPTVFFYLILLIEGGFGLWSLVAGCWPTIARLTYEWLR